MEPSQLSTTVVLTGVLPFTVVVASALAFPVCWALLKLYRRSVERGMRTAGAGSATAPAMASRPNAPSTRLSIQPVDEASRVEPARHDDAVYHLAAVGPWHTAALYALAGMAYAAVMTAGWLTATHHESIVWIKVLVLFWTYWWPAWLTAMLVAAYDRNRWLQLLTLYFVALGLLFSIALLRNPDLSMPQLALSWVIENAPPTVLLLAFLLRQIRAVGPLVLAFLLALAVGSQTVLSLAAAHPSILRALSGFGFSLGLGPAAVFVGMILAGTLSFGLLGWPLLLWLGRCYKRKRLSDQSLTVDSLWLLFGAVQSIGLAFEAPHWIMTGAAAFIAYKAVANLGFRMIGGCRRHVQPRTLLLLRVFALARRSELLFHQLRTHWLYAGSVSMIAGPDLVTTTVEPHEFLDFLTGYLGRQFVKDSSDLERRLTAMDRGRDPDGRYRINEFFCHNDTWQMTMERLAATSDAVLMDLRSFSLANQGCIFEIGRLVDGVDLTRVVFLADASTDRAFLDATLERLWDHIAADSPNRVAESPTVRVFRVSRQSDSDLRALLPLLFSARAPADRAT
jgi:hypothetical protein